MAGDETQEFINDRNSSAQPVPVTKSDAPKEIILNSGETMRVRENEPEKDPAIFNRDMIVQETKELQEAVDAQKETKPEKKEIVVEQPPVPEESREKFAKFIGEIEKQVTIFAAESLRRQAPYLKGDLSTKDYLELVLQRKKFRDEKEEQINERAQALNLSGPLVDDIKKYLDENLSTSQIITEKVRLESLWGALRPTLFPFVDAYDERRKRYQAERASRANPQQEKALKASLEDAKQQKKNAFNSMRSRIDHMGGLTADEKKALIILAEKVARPDEEIQRHGDESITNPPGLEPIKENPNTTNIPNIITQPVIITRPPVPDGETPPITPAPGRETPPETPPPLDHMPLELESKQEFYERNVRNLYRDVIDFEYKVNVVDQKNELTDELKKNFRNRMRIFAEQLLRLDEEAEDPERSEIRKELVVFLMRLRDRLTISDKKPTADTASVLNDVRTMHRHVLATYTSVQHELTIDQRREMRSRIAKFASLVRNTELEHTISHATEHAPLIAHGVLTSERD